jgi:hypothetical protein
LITHPTRDELLTAVIGFIERVAPQLQDRDVFLARVAVNALNVVRREVDAGPAAEAAAFERLQALLPQPGDFACLNTALSRAIRAGAFEHDEAALLAHLKSSALDQVRIDQPGYSGLKAAEASA